MTELMIYTSSSYAYYLMQIYSRISQITPYQDLISQYTNLPNMKPNQLKGIRPLQRSASLLIGKDNNKQLEFLFLKRKGSMSFSSMHVFPGGKCDPEDKVLSADFNEYGKITALRETFEETGLLVLPQQINQEEVLEKSEAQIVKQLPNYWKNRLDRIRPIIRLMTIQWSDMKRFDCLFYLPMSGFTIVNHKNATKNKAHHLDLSNIVYSADECQCAQWITAKSCLARNTVDINLSPPQVVILSCLQNLHSYSELREQLKDLGDVEPTLFMRVKGIGLCPRDKDYPWEELLKKEPSSESKTDLESLYKKIRSQPNSMSQIQRFQFPPKGLVNLELSLKNKTLFSLWRPNPSL